MTDFLDQPAFETAAAIASGALDPVDLMQATLARIAATNADANAIVSLRDEDALLAAARAAKDVPRKGWLHGMPLAVKDLANAQGLPTSMGSPVFAGTTAGKSDIFVQRMIDAGAIVIGKTNTPEFGLGSHTYNPVFGATQNALRPGTSAGGSSGGAAVALAHGMVSVADGSDMMGSLRNPAGWNGVYGMRPTWGRVPSEPDGDMFHHHLATSGPMARTPRDIAHLLEIQSGPDPRHPYGWPVQAYHQELDVDLRGKRIGWLGDWGGAFPMEDGVLGAAHAAVHSFSELGCEVVEVAAPFSRDAMWEAWMTLRSWAVSNGLGPLYDAPKTRDQLKPEAIWEVELGRSLSSAQIARASRLRSDWYRAAAAMFQRFDAVVLPTAQCWPFAIDWTWPKQIAGQTMDTYHRWMEVVVPCSLISLPCVAVPIKGMPMGLQLIGKTGDDLAMLQLAQGWHRLNT